MSARMFAGIAMLTGGIGLPRICTANPATSAMRTIDDYYGMNKRDILVPSNAVPPDRKQIFDKLTNVHYSGTQHDEDQPVHLLVHTEVCHTICGPRVWPPVRALLSRERLRDRRRWHRWAAAADQRVELRALQDLRHHGPVRRHHLGRRRKGAAARSTTACKSAEAEVRRPKLRMTSRLAVHWRKRRRGLRRSPGIGYPILRSAWGHLEVSRYRRRRRALSRPFAPLGHPIHAFWHGRILPGTIYFKRRGIVVITSENFDGEWIARIISRFGYGTARGSSSRGGPQGPAAAGARCEIERPWRSRSTALEVQPTSRSRARCGCPRSPATRYSVPPRGAGTGR